MSLIPIVLLSDFDPRAIFCSPDRGAVKVMKPIAKIIADDIVKNGIPKSLKDIKGLPYVLEGCERSEVYWDKNRKITLKQNAKYIKIMNKCYFEINNKKYIVELLFSEYSKRLKLYNQKTYTGIKYFFEYSENNTNLVLAKKSYGNPKIYDNKTSGICTQFKQ